MKFNHRSTFARIRYPRAAIEAMIKLSKTNTPKEIVNSVSAVKQDVRSSWYICDFKCVSKLRRVYTFTKITTRGDAAYLCCIILPRKLKSYTNWKAHPEKNTESTIFSTSNPLDLTFAHFYKPLLLIQRYPSTAAGPMIYKIALITAFPMYRWNRSTTLSATCSSCSSVSCGDLRRSSPS